MSCGEHGKAVKTEHTPEPWISDSGTGLVGTTASGAFETLAVVQCPRGIPEMQANARRIVACVNACAGLSTEFLEQIDSIQAALTGQLVVTEVLENQRDELLAAAEAIEIAAEECLDFDECTAMLVPIDTYHKLMEAVASVKEK